jgi:hypothetical protein
MGGVGSFPAGSGPAGGGTITLVAPSVKASRALLVQDRGPGALMAPGSVPDQRTLRYVVDPSGNLVGMDGTAQRVILTCQAAEIPIPIIYAAALEQQRQAYITALQGMVKEGAIKDVVVTVTDDGHQTVIRSIKFFNLRTSAADTVTL